MAPRTKSKQSGVGYIEVLVSSLILSLCILAALSLYGFSMNMITHTSDEGFAYNLGRKTVEIIRQEGFDPVDSSGNHVLPDGTTTLYYNQFGALSSNGTGAKDASSMFKVVTVIASLKPDGSGQADNVNGTLDPAPDAMRTVTVTVSYSESGEQIEQTGTVLARAGV